MKLENRIAGYYENNLEPLDRPVAKPDWGTACLLAAFVLAGIGLLLARMR